MWLTTIRRTRLFVTDITRRKIIFANILQHDMFPLNEIREVAQGGSEGDGATGGD